MTVYGIESCRQSTGLQCFFRITFFCPLSGMQCFHIVLSLELIQLATVIQSLSLQLIYWSTRLLSVYVQSCLLIYTVSLDFSINLQRFFRVYLSPSYSACHGALVIMSVHTHTKSPKKRCGPINLLQRPFPTKHYKRIT